MRPSSGSFGFMNTLIATKTLFKIRQSKIALKQALTLKLAGPDCNPGLRFH